MKSKILIFDFSGVSSANEEPIFVKLFAEREGLDVEEFEKAYEEEVVRAERDEITGTDIWKNLASRFQLEIDVDAVIDEMLAMKDIYYDVLEYVGSLRDRYKVAMYSNYNRTYWEKILEKVDINKYFDYVQISYMVGKRKTDEGGFKVILEKFGVSAADCLFIDDSSRNLVPAQKLGMKTVLFTSLEDLKKELATL